MITIREVGKAMVNGPCIDVLPIKSGEISIAMLNHQNVTYRI
jgi:hypothetical protein